jgi:hypothetical protein
VSHRLSIDCSTVCSGAEGWITRRLACNWLTGQPRVARGTLDSCARAGALADVRRLDDLAHKMFDSDALAHVQVVVICVLRRAL